MRQRAGRHIGAAAQAGQFQRRAGGLPQRRRRVRRPPEAEAVAAPRLHRHGHVLQRGEGLEHRGDLVRARQPAPHAPFDGHAGHVHAVQQHPAAVRPQLAAQLADQRGLARAVGADHGVQLARPHLQRQVVRDGQAAVALEQVFDAQRAHRGSPVGQGRARGGRTPGRFRQRAVQAASRQQHHAHDQQAHRQHPVVGQQLEPFLQQQGQGAGDGPNSVPMPPSATITISSPEVVQARYEGETYSVRLASSTPATPHSIADST